MRKLISSSYGIRLLKTEEGDTPYWMWRLEKGDPMVYDWTEDIDWETLSAVEFSKVAHNYQIDVKGSRIPLVVMMTNMRSFAVPAKWQNKFFTCSLLLNQSSKWRSSVDIGWIRMSDKHRKYMDQRLDQTIGFLTDLYTDWPLNLSAQLEVMARLDKMGERIVLNEDSEKMSIKIGGEEVVLHAEAEEKFFRIKDQWIVENGFLKRREKHKDSRIYCRKKMSYGEEFFISDDYKDRETDHAKGRVLDGILYTEVELNSDMKLLLDEIELKRIRNYPISQPPIALSKMDPMLYSKYLEYYCNEVRENHDTIVKAISPFVEAPLIVPCDGMGTWERLWEEEGVFGDLNYEGRRIKKENCYQTLKRGQGYGKGTIILMYCLGMLEQREIDIIRKMLQSLSYNLIVIDTTRRMVPWKMRRINNLMMVSENKQFPPMAAFLHDTERTTKNVKYSNILLSITDPWFPSSNMYRDYWYVMNPMGKSSKKTEVYQHLGEWYLCKTKGKEHYLANAGIFNPTIMEFLPHKRLYLRQVYRCAKEWWSIIPSFFDKIQTKDEVLFICTDEQHSQVRFEGYCNNLQMNMPLHFYDKSLRETAMTFNDMMKKYKGRKMTMEEIMELCFTFQIDENEDEIESRIANNPNIHRVVREGIVSYVWKVG